MNNKGFTLIEFVAVLVIICIIAAVVIPKIVIAKKTRQIHMSLTHDYEIKHDVLQTWITNAYYNENIKDSSELREYIINKYLDTNKTQNIIEKVEPTKQKNKTECIIAGEYIIFTKDVTTAKFLNMLTKQIDNNFNSIESVEQDDTYIKVKMSRY